MKKVYTYKNLTWIDIVNPTRAEILDLMTHFGFTTRVAEELLVPTPRPKVDVYDDHVYLVLHFPGSANAKDQQTRDEQEIDFIIGPESLITVRYAPMDAVLEFSKMIEVSALLDRDTVGDHAGFLFYHLIAIFYKQIESQLHTINTTLKSIETRIFQGEEESMVRVISNTNRQLLDHTRSLRFHGMTLEDLERAAPGVFGTGFSYYIDRLSRLYQEIKAILESDKQILDDLKDTNDMLLTTKTNHIMKILTIVAFIMVPVSIAMEVLKRPIESISHTSVSIFIIAATTLILVLGLFAFVRYKKWL